jgi:hypothetical protein
MGTKTKAPGARATEAARRGRIWLRPRLRLGVFRRAPVWSLKNLSNAHGPLQGTFALGRDALWHIATSIFAARDCCAWLPAYSCRELVEAFSAAGVRLQFYDVRPDLTVDWQAVLASRKRKAGRHGLVFIDYFGFPQPMTPGDRETIKDVFEIVVRDAAHSLPCAGVEPVKGGVLTCCVYSLRKPLPVPDLALVFAAGDGFEPGTGGSRPRRRFTLLEVAGLILPPLRHRTFFRGMRQRLKGVSRLGVPASRFSEVLACRFDLDEVMAERRARARSLLEGLSGEALFSSVPTNACPYYFPVRIPRPAIGRQRLWKEGIETTTFWTFDEGLGPEFPGAREVASRLLCLPVHQDLADDEIQRIAATTAHVKAAT